MPRRFRLIRGALLALPLAAAAPADAPAFELAYGLASQVERANRGVAPVTHCPGGGSIAVGTMGAPPATRAYAVRSGAGGAGIWERIYDVQPGRVDDTGESVVEASDGSGFVIAGVTRTAAAGRDAFLLKVRCDGSPDWVRIYHSPGDEGALDVIEARTGDPASGTRRGDLIVAGFATLVPGLRNGLLFRTDGAGALIWDRRYQITFGRSAFHGVTEAGPSGNATTGDVVAAGVITIGSVQQGYVARVSGNDGEFAGAPHCAAAYPGLGRARFDSVLAQGSTAGSLVMAGITTGPGATRDVFLVRSGPNPCVPIVQRSVGDGTTHEAALDVQELVHPLNVAPAGALALTGAATRPGVPGTDAFLLVANPFDLAPLAGSLFGNHGGGLEDGVSLAALPDGFLIAGRTTTDFAGVGDPADLYLVRADTNGRTSCSIGWAPPSRRLDDQPMVLPLAPQPFLETFRGARVSARPSTRFEACP